MGRCRWYRLSVVVAGLAAVAALAAPAGALPSGAAPMFVPDRWVAPQEGWAPQVDGDAQGDLLVASLGQDPASGTPRAILRSLTSLTGGRRWERSFDVRNLWSSGV